MSYRSSLSLLLLFGACVGPTLDVTPLHPAPQPLAPRDIATVVEFPAEPQGAIAVYQLQAKGGSSAELHQAVREKAAALGCDGVLVTVEQKTTTYRGSTDMASLNDHRNVESAHLSALCLVVPPRTGSR